jgi:magnesium-transporting ATPase (P-type)
LRYSADKLRPPGSTVLGGQNNGKESHSDRNDGTRAREMPSAERRGESAQYALIQYDNELQGFDEDKVEEMRDQYGVNLITHQKKISLLRRLWDAFVNLFAVVLFALTLIST